MRKILFTISMIALMGCGNPSVDLKTPAGNASQNWPCPNATSLMFDVAYSSLTEQNHIPTVAELVDAYKEALKEKSISFDQQEYLKQVENFYSTILNGADTSSTTAVLQHIAAIEVGDQSEAQAVSRQKALSNFKAQYKYFVAKNNGTCPTPTPTPAPQPNPQPTPVTPPDRVLTNPISFGANKTMSVAYQSCAAIERAPLVKNDADVEGIIVTGTNGVGHFREISDLKALVRTDHYLQGGLASPNECVDVKLSPPIYNFGGKPYTTATLRSLDLFKRAGSGGKTLGIDCSGFVFTSISSAGLRLSPGTPIKTVMAYGVSAKMYKEPDQNGLSCFTKIPVGTSGTLKAGDVIAHIGHVIIVESTGRDPLGITHAKSEAECQAITIQDFDFTIIQSSASKNGIGINKYIAKDYLQNDLFMRSGLESYARQACTARLRGKDVVVTGQSAQVVRHSQSADCMDTPVTLVGENCTSRCPTLQ